MEYGSPTDPEYATGNQSAGLWTRAASIAI
jgi:hypothetical protein